MTSFLYICFENVKKEKVALLKKFNEIYFINDDNNVSEETKTNCMENCSSENILEIYYHELVKKNVKKGAKLLLAYSFKEPEIFTEKKKLFDDFLYDFKEERIVSFSDMRKNDVKILFFLKLLPAQIYKEKWKLCYGIHEGTLRSRKQKNL